MKTLSSCTICNSNEITLLKNFEKLYLVKCKQCSFVFDKRIPTQEELYEHYKVYSYSTLKPLPKETSKSYNKLLDEFEKYRKNGNILDISCGQGDFLIEAKKRNWNVYGTEFSKSAVDICLSRGINMYKGDLNKKIFQNISFDVVTSFEVIEHINTPQSFIEVSNYKLRNNGLLYCTTPNFDAILRFMEKDKFKIINYPEHISFFTKKSISILGDRYNLKKIKILTSGLDIGRFINILKNKKDIPYDRNIIKQNNENIRNLSGNNKFFGLLKYIINFCLNIFNKGDTLKIYWIKK